MPQVLITHNTLLAAGFILKEKLENNHPLAPIKVCFKNCYWKNDLMIEKYHNAYVLSRIQMSDTTFGATILGTGLKYINDISKVLNEHLHTSILNSISKQRY